MTIWLLTAGWCGVGLGALLLAAFVLQSLREREWRAAWISAVVGLGLLAGLAAPLGLAFPGWELVVAAELGALALLLILLALPLGASGVIRVVGAQAPVDERDAVFHRFYRLEPGMEEYEEYYRDDLERKTFDDRVRAMPGLAAPDSKSFHPHTSPFARATFDVIEGIVGELDSPPAPLQEHRVEQSPELLARRIKGFARHHGARLVGCTRLNPAYIYSHNARGPGAWGAPIELAHGYAVAIAVEMDHELVRLAPAGATLAESGGQYLESAKIALLVARYLQRLGWEARAHVDMNYRVLCVPIAVDAGLGELGRIGMLLTPQYGPRVRLAVVTTTAPLLQDPPGRFGAAAFCEVCLKCADACPANAIARGPREIHAGVEKWQSRGDTCYRYWRTQGTDCALCMRVCPFSHPSSLVHDMIRLAVRRNRLARRLALWGDDLCYGRTPRRSYPTPDWHDPRLG